MMNEQKIAIQNFQTNLHPARVLFQCDNIAGVLILPHLNA